MNEQLFIDAAQIRANSRPSQHPAPRGGDAEVAVLTRRAVAFAAALLVNLAVLGTLQWSAANAGYAPRGEVVITQLESSPKVQLARN